MTIQDIGDDERDEAASRLDYWLGTDRSGRKLLRQYVDDNFPGCEQLYLSLKTGRRVDHDVIDDDRLSRFLIDIAGVELFEGDTGKNLRDIILDSVYAKDIWQIRRLWGVEDGTTWDSGVAMHAIQKIRRKPWKSGGRWARCFVDELGFPSQFSGVASPPAPENIEVAERRPTLGNLEDFQRNLKSQLAGVMGASSGHRCILSLPTGAGKTRIAAEAIIDYWKKRPKQVRWIVWIANKEELCEQAVQCFKQLWEEIGLHNDPLRIHRVWGDKYLPGSDDSGVIVAGIDKLYEYERNVPDTAQGPLARMLRGIGLVVVDEAHHAVSHKYKKTLPSLGIPATSNASCNIPLIGLTATPFRSASNETLRLRRMFGSALLAPSADHEPTGIFDEKWKDWQYMKEKLTERGVLSRPVFRPLESSTSFVMDKRESEYHKKMKQFSTSLLDRVGIDTQRNMEVFNAIYSEASAGKTVLFFGTNVNQALMMSKILNDRGIRSAVVTGATGHGARSEYVNMFKVGRIRVLCNYQVLTTGFDAPRTDSVVIARTTGSRVLYEQMIGRGLRGPKFGGTDECTITTMLDNIWNYERKKRVRLACEKYIESSGIMADVDRELMNAAIRRLGF